MRPAPSARVRKVPSVLYVKLSSRRPNLRVFSSWAVEGS